jgi:methionine-rich copper-binding protein CopC
LLTVRLACVKHAASVRSEPGSNSQVHPVQNKIQLNINKSIQAFFRPNKTKALLTYRPHATKSAKANSENTDIQSVCVNASKEITSAKTPPVIK